MDPETYISRILQGLNSEQNDAVTCTDGPVLIIAGAGTGKTTVIARRIAYIIGSRLAKQNEILALTFTDKAANEMEERVDVLLPFGSFDTQISTFHSFGERILRENALEIGLPTDFKILSRPQQVLFFQQNLFNFNLKHYRPLSTPTKFIQALITLFSRTKDETISPQAYKEYAQSLLALSAGGNESAVSTDNQSQSDLIEAELQMELATVYEQYESFKAQAGVLDFGDLIIKVKELFEHYPNTLKHYQNKFKYILVDEYQDTNFAQNEIVKLLAAKHENICVVGDDDQSIYRFRGAAISNILAFQDTYPKSNKVILTTNYRSTQPILDAAYRLITNNNPDRLEAKHNISKKLRSAKSETGFPIQTIFAATLSEETDAVIAEIERLTSTGQTPHISQDKKQPGGLAARPQFDEPITYNDIAILVRANANAEPFLKSMAVNGIPYKFTGTSGLYDTPEIKDLITFLTVLANFNDNMQLYSLATSRYFDIPIVDLVKLMDLCGKKSKPLFWAFSHADGFAELLELSDEGLKSIQSIYADIITYVQLSKNEAVGKVLYQFLADKGVIGSLQNAETAESATAVANIGKFFDKITEFSRLSTSQSVMAFIDYLSALREAGDDPGTGSLDIEFDGINILTVHGAKGLEYKVVFIVNAVSDRFPSRNKSEPIELPEALIKETLPEGDFHLQEERRLFYVALTRASDLLYITWAQDYGGKRLKKVSPFVAESLGLDNIPKSLFVSKSTKKLEQLNLFYGSNPVPVKTTQKPSNQITLLIDEEQLIKVNQAQIEDYLTCPKRYEYSAIMKIPLAGNHLFVYGRAIHSAIQSFYKYKMGGKVIPLEEMLACFERAWSDEGFLSEIHEKERFMRGKSVIKDFWDREKASSPPPTWIEKKFTIPLKNTIQLVGRYDRVDITGDFVHIIDFKTTENVGSEKALKRTKESKQLACYALGFYKMFNKLPNKLSLYFVETGIMGTYEPTMETIEKAECYIQEAVQGIRDGNFAPKPDVFNCQYCSYNKICPVAAVRT